MQFVVKRSGPSKSSNSSAGDTVSIRVADEVWVLLEHRVAVGGQLFAVGVDVYPDIPGLLEDLLEVFEVVGGDQEARTGSR